MATLASPEDVALDLRRQLEGDESDWIQVLLDRCEAQIRTRVPDLDERVAASTIYRTLAIMVEVNAVTRKVSNPDGIQYEVEGAYAYTRNAATASGAFEITEDEWRWLGAHAGAFTFQPTLPVREGTWPLNWWELNI